MTSENNTGATRMMVQSYEDFLQEELRDPALAAAYLTAALEGSQEEFLLALRSVADAHGGLAAVAEATQLNRQTLYRTLSGQGNPTLATLQGVLRAVGLTLAFAPAPSVP
jgi:probable addiction module antidote protein